MAFFRHLRPLRNAAGQIICAFPTSMCGGIRAGGLALQTVRPDPLAELFSTGRTVLAAIAAGSIGSGAITP
jgi:hypothetical protein